MSDIRLTNLTEGARRGLVAGTLAAAVLTAPAGAAAFSQQTSLEGAVGRDIGGVWLSVQNVMPEFRISYPKPVDGPAVPVETGPVPAELAPVTGGKPVGVSIKACTDARFCADYGVLVGDIILKVNSVDVPDAEAFAQAVEAAPKNVMLSIRRPSLKMSTVRLLKIKHDGRTREEDGASVVEEQVDVRVLDVVLPFAEAIENARRTNVLFVPSKKELDDLAAHWQELQGNAPPLFTAGRHRFVAKASFDPSLASDVALQDSAFALLLDLDANPMGGGGGKVVDLYGIEKIDGDSMEGNYVTATIANAPFPINIEFKGAFRMTRLGPWSDEDDKIRSARIRKANPPEDLDKYKTLPDVPPPSGKSD